MDNELENPLVYNLAGLELEDGWKVIKRIINKDQNTGGNFSVGYMVEKQDGTQGFLKAINLSQVLRMPGQNRTQQLAILTNDYNFEKSVLLKCYDKRMKHIIKLVGAGEKTQDGYLVYVPYLIFEYVPNTVRKELENIYNQLDIVLNMKWLHSIAVGMEELHKAGIAHLDLKPSNVLISEDKESKITDFGRSVMKNSEYTPSHYYVSYKGDKTYAPLEYIYGEKGENNYEDEWGVDFYLLGSLIYQFFTGNSITQDILLNLEEGYLPKKMYGAYNSVKPYIINTYSKVMNAFYLKLQESVESKLAEEIYNIVNEMCTPIKEERGDPQRIKRQSPKYELERYITRLDLITKKLEITLSGKVK